MVIYEFLFNWSTCESAAETISIHKTLAGAYRAMRAHRLAACVEYREERLRFGTDFLTRRHKYDDWKWWGIRKRTLAC